MYCPHCGAENEEVRPLCYRCGMALDNLAPAGARRAGFRERFGFLIGPLLLLVAGLGLLAIFFGLLFALAPEPQARPTSMPAAARRALAPAASPGPRARPTPVVLASLAGRVVDQRTAQPLAGALVLAGDRVTLAGDQGQYEIGNLAPGQVVVVAVYGGYDPGWSPIVSLVGGEARSVDLALVPQGTVGEVADPAGTQPMDPGGAPTGDEALRLARAQGLVGEVRTVEAVTLRGKYWVNCQEEERVRAALATLDHKGWALSDEGGQVWRIVADWGSLAVPVPPGWVLPTPAAGSTRQAALLEGQVVDEASGQPVGGAQVSVGQRLATTDPEGSFLFPDLPQGQYSVLVTAADYDPTLSGIVAVEAGQQVVVAPALPPVGAGQYSEDPMATNQIDPAGAPTAGDAERLADMDRQRRRQRFDPV